MAALLPPSLTLTGAAAGGWLFALLGFPAPWLAGPMTAVAAAALAGAPVAVPRQLSHAAFLVVGMAMGSAVTPATLAQLASWPVSLVLLALSVAGTIVGISFYLRRVHGWDPMTARYAAIPGALTSVLLLAATTSADVPRVALAQSLRLFVLVALIPLIVGSGAQPGTPTVDLGPPWTSPPGLLELAIVLAAALAATGLGRLVRAPAAAMLGGMVGSAVVHGTGFVTVSLPGPVLIAAFIVSGAIIGQRFRGAGLSVLVGSLRAGLESIAIGIAVSVVLAWLGTWLTGLPFGQLWLAYAPGGLEAMAILAFLLDLDPAFVGAHHIARYLGLSVLVPLWRAPRYDRTSEPRREP